MCYTGLCPYEDYLGDCSASGLYGKVWNRYGFSLCVFANYPIDGCEDKIDPEVVKFIKDNEDTIAILYKDFQERQKKRDWEEVREHPWRYLKR